MATQIDPAILASALGEQAAPSQQAPQASQAGVQVASSEAPSATAQAGATPPSAPADDRDTSSLDDGRDLSPLDAPAQPPATTAVPTEAASTAHGGYQLPDAGGGLQQDIGRTFAAAGGGALAGVFHTYDFFTGGEPPQANKSAFRQRVEAMNSALVGDQGVHGALAEGLGEFLPGLIGTEGVLSAAEAVPKVGAAVSAAVEGAPKIAGAVKGAVAGFLSLDPHGGNIANLVDTYAPALSNPVTSALAAHPDDSETMGRVKNAVTSLGFDAAVAGIIKGSVGVFHYLAKGDTEGAAAAAKEAQKAQDLMAQGNQPEPPAAPASDIRQTVKSANDNVTGGFNDNTPFALADLRTPNRAPELTPGITGSAGGEGAIQAAKAAADRKAGLGITQQAGPRFGPDGVQLELPAGTIGERTEAAMTAAQNAEAPATGPGTRAAEATEAQATATRAGADKTTAAMQAAAGNGPQELSLGDSARQFLDGGPRAQATILGPQSGMPRVSQGTDIPQPFDPRVGPQVPKDGLPVPGTTDTAPPLTITPKASEVSAPGQAEKLGSTVTEEVSSKPVKWSLPDFPVEQAQAIADSARGDLKALADNNGDWNTAIQNHAFGQGEGIPWQKMAGPDDANIFMSRMVDALKGQFDEAKGGDVQSDARVNQMVAQRAQLYNVNPAALMARLQGAGKAGAEMAANMEASTLIATRAVGDITSLSARINAGDLVAYGGDLQAAQADLARRMAVFQAAYSSAQSLKSNAGRTLRRMRTEFQVDPDVLTKLRTVDPEQLAELVGKLGGDPAKMAKLVQPGYLARLTDRAGFYYMSNLLSRPETHWVGAFTNTAQMLNRPFERIVGSFGVGNAGASIREQAFRQYYFMGASLMDGMRAGKESFLSGDGKISPHANDIRNAAAPLLQHTPLPFTSADGIGGNLYNTLLSSVARPLWNTLTIGPRLLGAVDEIHKMITYRSMVLAKAHMDGSAEARSMGLLGPAGRAHVSDFINRKMDAAFDENGFATDMDARHEAEVATFSQPLLQGTLGKGMQNLVSAHPGLRVLLPFVRGPTNILRYAQKMTPGLNLLQQEYRDMITGKMGQEAQAQAIGQMGLASSIVGSGAFLASEGRITGGGPADPQARNQLKATGWQPYSFVFRDGNTTHYVPFGKYDPVSVPFGIVADIVQLVQHPAASDGIGGTTAAVMMSVAKALANKSYLTSITGLMDTLSSNNENKWNRFLGQQLSNWSPLSAGQRWLTNTVTDGYMRDARSITDQVMANTPGFSTSLPPVRDAWGDPVHQLPMLYSQHHDDPVDQEVQRLTLEVGGDSKSISPPSPRLQNGVDLRTVPMKNGKDSYDAMQEYAGHPPGAPPLREVVKGIMTSDAYARAPDGPATINGTKLHMLEGPVRDYRNAATKWISSDPNVATALQSAQVKVASAYATTKKDPTGAKGNAATLNNIVTGLTGLNPGVHP